MWNVKSAPPLPPLVEIVERLERAGVVCALGGSGLLAALGLADEVRDWDLTTDAELDAVVAILDEVPHERVGPSGVHADHKLMFDDGRVELIVRFALRSAESVVRIPTFVSERSHGVPLGSPEAWAVAYELMDRPAKAQLLFDHLRATGANPSVIDRLQAEPLPAKVRATLSALSTRGEATD